jgi:hypothetical protein
LAKTGSLPGSINLFLPLHLTPTDGVYKCYMEYNIFLKKASINGIEKRKWGGRVMQRMKRK